MKLIIHGGFFSESSQSNETKLLKQRAISKIVTDSYEFLKTHTALETAVFAITLLENDELFNAGTGSMIQSDGKIRMSASLMDGVSKKMSGVINIENVKNPIQIALELQKEQDRILAGEGAETYARKLGIPSCSVETKSRRKEYETKLKSLGMGTVGCVVIDHKGHIAAGTSTGGKGFELVGRVSDSATVAGNYANDFCGVSLTGVGEDIVSGAMAAKIVTRVTDGMTLTTAVQKTFEEIKPFDGFAGAICIDSQGNIAHLDSFPSMVYASYDGIVLDVFG
jgi:L-asparaginase